MKLYYLHTKIKEYEELLKELKRQMYDKNERCEATKFVRENPIAYTVIFDDGYKLEYKPDVIVVDGWKYIRIDKSRSAEAFRYALKIYDTLSKKENVDFVQIHTKNPEKVNYGKLYVGVRMVEDKP